MCLLNMRIHISFCILPSFSFLHPDPLLNTLTAAEHHAVIQFITTGQCCSAWRSHAIAQGMATVGAIKSVCNQGPTVAEGKAQQKQEHPQHSANSVCNSVCREEACTQARLLCYLKVSVTGKDVKPYKLLFYHLTKSIHLSTNPWRTAQHHSLPTARTDVLPSCL